MEPWSDTKRALDWVWKLKKNGVNIKQKLKQNEKNFYSILLIHILDVQHNGHATGS